MKCPKCEREFKSERGLGLHMANAHVGSLSEAINGKGKEGTRHSEATPRRQETGKSPEPETRDDDEESLVIL